MEDMSPLQIDKHQPHKIFEITGAELQEPSGILDDDGTEMTNLETIRAIETAAGSQMVTLSMNGHLSPEAKAHNTSVTNRDGDRSEYKFAVLSMRPPSHR